jgi:radical SAM protein (TIGR01212 family)
MEGRGKCWMMDTPITTFTQYYKKKYGQPVGKIALDVGIVCPNRDRGGCIYCAAVNFTPYYLKKGDTIDKQLQKGKSFLAKRKFVKYFAYFQQETTTAMAADDLLPTLTVPLADPDCIGLIISTRPDYIEQDLLNGLREIRKTHKKEILVELGLQSAHDATLKFLNRNHSFQDFVDAVERIQRFDFIELGVHLILGLPGEDLRDMIATIHEIRNLKIDYIKFHHLQVIRGTKLQAMYESEPFAVYDAHEYLTMVAELLGHIPPQVVMHRLWSTADPRLLIAPQWGTPAPARLHNELLQIMEEKGLYQGRYLEP